MGKVGRTLFGGPSEQKSASGNHAWDAVSGAMTPALGYTAQGGDAIANLLGLNGGPAQTAGLETFANSGGMKFLRDQANEQVTSNQAAKGLLNSGSTLTALQDRGHGLASTYLNSYMDKLFNFSDIGTKSAATMTGAGSWSKGSGQGEKKGIASQLAQVAAAFA
jgi:hypothetical protein